MNVLHVHDAINILNTFMIIVMQKNKTFDTQNLNIYELRDKYLQIYDESISQGLLIDITEEPCD